MSNALIGKRLAQLRSELAVPGEGNWSQARLSEEIGLTPNQLQRVEYPGTGSMEVFVKILTFYQLRGININWILMADNSAVSKNNLSGMGKSVSNSTVLGKLSELKEALVKEVDSVSEFFAE